MQGFLYALFFTMLITACGDREHSAAVPLPDSPITLRVVLNHSHPYLAEYDRWLILERGGHVQSKTKLFPDTGGYASVNVYRVDSEVVLLTQGDDDYHIDLQSGRLTKTPKVRGKGRSQVLGEFLGVFDFDTDGTWQFIPASFRPEQTIEPDQYK